eukprot:48847-Amphidinium_carterae.1
MVNTDTHIVLKMLEADGLDDDVTVWSIPMEKHSDLKKGAATILEAYFGHGIARNGMQAKIKSEQKMLGSLLESKLDLVTDKISKPIDAEERGNLPIKPEVDLRGPTPSSPPCGIVMVKDELISPPRHIIVKAEPEMSPLRHHHTLEIIDLITEKDSQFIVWNAYDE